MVLLKLVNDVSGINFYEYRDRIFYNKYTYRARFVLAGIRFTSFAKTAKELRNRLANIKNTVLSKELTSARENVEALCEFIEWRNKCYKDKTVTIRVEQDVAAVFSNNLDLLHELKNFNQSIMVDFTEAKVSQFIGVKYFVNEPKHKFRVYLKSKRIDKTSTFHAELNSLLERSEDLHPCPSLNEWLKDGIFGRPVRWYIQYTKASHFIDYDDESTLSYLALMYNEILGKKYKLEKRIEPI